MTDFIARAKWDAWQGQTGKSQEQAMQEYIALFETLKA
jgi:acyl-CoA-binding protein